MAWSGRPPTEGERFPPLGGAREDSGTRAALRDTAHTASPEDDEDARWTSADEAAGSATEPRVDVLVSRLQASRSTGDWTAFRKHLCALAESKTPDACRALAVFLEDETLTFPEPVGQIFHEGLEGASLTGLADAARGRFEQEVESGNTSWTAAAGWLQIVADHGSESDRVWLLARAESDQVQAQALSALARSTRVETAGLIIDWLEDPEWKSDRAWLLSKLAQGHPQAAHDFARRCIEGARDGHAPPRGLALVDRMRVLGAAAPESQLVEIGTLLRSLQDEEQRILAVYAVEAMRRRGLDITSMTSLTRAPLDQLERLSPGLQVEPPMERGAYLATQAIGANRVVWSPSATRRRTLSPLGDRGEFRPRDPARVRPRRGLSSHRPARARSGPARDEASRTPSCTSPPCRGKHPGS